MLRQSSPKVVCTHTKRVTSNIVHHVINKSGLSSKLPECVRKALTFIAFEHQYQKHVVRTSAEQVARDDKWCGRWDMCVHLLKDAEA